MENQRHRYIKVGNEKLRVQYLKQNNSSNNTFLKNFKFVKKLFVQSLLSKTIIRGRHFAGFILKEYDSPYFLHIEWEVLKIATHCFGNVIYIFWSVNTQDVAQYTLLQALS